MTDGERRRLVISEDDLAGQPASPPPPGPPPPTHPPMPPVSAQAQSFPTVQGVGSPPRPVSVGPSPTFSSVQPPALQFLRTVQGRNIAAAATGITVGWAVCQITGFGQIPGLWTPTTKVGLDATTAAWTAVLGAIFAVVYAGWEHILARSWEGVRLVSIRAVSWGLSLAFIAGFIAQAVYLHFYLQIVRTLTLTDLATLSSNIKFYLARSLAWGLFGVGMGVAVAGGLKSTDKLVNGVIGGGIGGALGGIVFQYAGFHIQSNAVAQLVGLLVVGSGIGLAIGIVEKARRDAWIQVTGGPMAGKEFILYGADATVGSSPKCDVTLIKDVAIQPFHAVIRTVDGAGGQRRVLDAYEGCTVAVNGQPSVHHLLHSGDFLAIGSTMVGYSERAASP